MSKSRITKQEERAELEYYEKTGRRARWTEIGHMFGKLQGKVKEYIKDYCEKPKEERGEEYIARVREERVLLHKILKGMDSVNGAVLEGIAKYATEEPNRPNWLP